MSFQIEDFGAGEMGFDKWLLEKVFLLRLLG